MSELKFGRRALLKVAGATLAVPSFLQSAFASPSEPRLVIIMQACGTHKRTFWPDPATGTSPILEPLRSDPALVAKTLLIRGIENRTRGLGNEHDRGFSSLWSGVKPVGTQDDAFGGGPSIDQQLKRLLRPRVAFPTLNCGVLASSVPAKNGHRASFSYIAAKQQIPTLVDPYRLYTALFPERGSESRELAARRLALRRSALDYAARDLSDLARRLGPKERQKLDAHTTALREFEERLIAASSGGAQVCARPELNGARLDLTQEDNVPLLSELMLDLVAAAISCNLTRIVTFQLGLCGNQWRYRWIGIDEDSHEIAHSDTPDGSNVAAAEKMTRISRWAATQVARLAQRLEAIPDGSATALDQSLIVWANENSTGFHSVDDLPVVFLGRAAGRLARSGIVDAGRQSHYQLGTTVMRLMGVDAAGFGDEPSSGPLLGV